VQTTSLATYFTISPSFCLTGPVEFRNPSGISEFEYNSSGQVFQIRQISTLTPLAGEPISKTYLVTFALPWSTDGTNLDQEATSFFTITLSNPCFDTSYVSIGTVTLDTITYVVEAVTA